MPLTELLRMFNQNVDATNDGATTADFSRLDSDFVELVWENGQIMMQGQSSRCPKYPSTNDLQTYMPKPQDCRDDTGSRMTKFSTMDTAFSDFPMSVPSCELGLDQDAEMVPWLSYPTEDALHSDYACNFLPELSSVTLNDTSTENHIAVRERKSGFLVDGHDKFMNPKHGDAPKAASNNGQKYARGESSDVPQTSSPFQHNVLKSGTSGITAENASYPDHLASRDSSLSAFSNLRLQKLNGGQSVTSSGFTNFSHFSRPAALARANHQAVNSSKRLEISERRCTVTSSIPVNSSAVNLGSGFSQKEIISNNQPALAPVAENFKISPTKTNEDSLSANQSIHGDVAKKDTVLPRAYVLGKSKAVMDGDKNMEPVVAASSVCSGNSVERASSEAPAHNLKRKSRETTESEDPSEEVEGESVGAKKGGHARFGSKRTRAAEVHNLSERRRRDRINEKMRSLQELIPNCNKVDKASMLDEAIEYLKTLQLQVQMLSMGAGFYMPPMMIPPGMQPIHGAHMPHFSPMGLGMGMGMGFGMNMLDANGGVKMLPFQGPHYPIPGAGAPFHGMPSSSLQSYGHPGQGLPMSMQRGPVHPVPGTPSFNLPMGLNLSGATSSKDASQLAPSNSSKEADPQVIPRNNLNNSIHQAPNQESNKQIQASTSSHDLTKATDASAAPEAPRETDIARS